MNLPKHTTQVGTIAANKKFYLEDYCISYMKQLCESYPEERKQIALFGTVEREKGTEYAFVYGAALLGRGKGRTDSLTVSQKEEAESFRQEFFAGYQLVGVVISNDLVNENIYWIGNGSKSIQMDGYYIFYDTNETMLNFMMKNQCEEREVDLDPVIVKKADMDREKRERSERQRQESLQKKGIYRKKIQSETKTVRPERPKRGNPFPVVACLLTLAILGIFGVKRYYPAFGYEQVVNYVSGLWKNTGNFGDSYLDTDKESLALAEGQEESEMTQETGAAEEETMVIVSAEVAGPAEMEVVVIPNLEEVKEPAETSENKEIAAESTEALKPEIEKPEPEKSESEKIEPEKEVTVPEVPAEPEKYLIQKGDNLLRILRSHYGDESKLNEICDVNNIADPNNIQVGQTILLP